MEVIKEIKNNPFVTNVNYNIEGDFIIEGLTSTEILDIIINREDFKSDLEMCYFGVIEFIKWYNQNKEKGTEKMSKAKAKITEMLGKENVRFFKTSTCIGFFWILGENNEAEFSKFCDTDSESECALLELYSDLKLELKSLRGEI